jgi:hypothetical protein
MTTRKPEKKFKPSIPGRPHHVLKNFGRLFKTGARFLELVELPAQSVALLLEAGKPVARRRGDGAVTISCPATGVNAGHLSLERAGGDGASGLRCAFGKH